MGPICITDPAQTLLGDTSNINALQSTNVGLVAGESADLDESARRRQDRWSLSDTVASTGEEDRPFNCPVIGCEKIYKNVNGLRYHEKVSPLSLVYRRY